jgi:ribosomal protein L7/L12
MGHIDMDFAEMADKLIVRLHDEQRSVIETIKVVRQTLGISLGEAKMLVSRHPVWHKVVEANAPLHETAEWILENQDSLLLDEDSAN